MRAKFRALEDCIKSVEDEELDILIQGDMDIKGIIKLTECYCDDYSLNLVLHNIEIEIPFENMKEYNIKKDIYIKTESLEISIGNILK